MASGGWRWRGEGRSKQAAPVPTLCMQLSPQTLEGSPSKDSALRDLPLSGADICTAHPQTGRGRALPACRTPKLLQCNCTVLHMLGANYQWPPITISLTHTIINPTNLPIFNICPPYFGCICEQFWLDLYESKFGWKTSNFEPPGVLVSPSPISTGAVSIWTSSQLYTMHIAHIAFILCCFLVHHIISALHQMCALHCVSIEMLTNTQLCFYFFLKALSLSSPFQSFSSELFLASPLSAK